MVKNKLVNITKKKVNNKNMVISSVKSKSKFSKNNRNKSRVQKSKRKFQQRQRGTKNIKRNKLSKRIFSNKSYRLKNKKTKKSKLMKLAMLGGGPVKGQLVLTGPPIPSNEQIYPLINSDYLTKFIEKCIGKIKENKIKIDDKQKKTEIENIIKSIFDTIIRKKNLSYLSNAFFSSEMFSDLYTLKFNASDFELKYKTNNHPDTEYIEINPNLGIGNSKYHKKLFESLDVISKNKLKTEVETQNKKVEAQNKCICLFCEEYIVNDTKNEFLNFDCNEGDIINKINKNREGNGQQINKINYSIFPDEVNEIMFINIHSSSGVTQQALVDSIVNLKDNTELKETYPNIETYTTIIGGDSNVYYNRFESPEEQETANPDGNGDIKQGTYVPIIQLMRMFNEKGYNVLISKNIVFKTRPHNLFDNSQALYKRGDEPVETMFIAYPKTMDETIKYDTNLYFNSKDLDTITQLVKYKDELNKMETELEKKKSQTNVEDTNILTISELQDLIKLRTILNPGYLAAFKGFDGGSYTYNGIFGLDALGVRDNTNVGELMSDHVPIYMDIKLSENNHQRVIYSNNVSMMHKSRGLKIGDTPNTNLKDVNKELINIFLEELVKIHAGEKDVENAGETPGKNAGETPGENAYKKTKNLSNKNIEINNDLEIILKKINTYVTWTKVKNDVWKSLLKSNILMINSLRNIKDTDIENIIDLGGGDQGKIMFVRKNPMTEEEKTEEEKTEEEKKVKEKEKKINDYQEKLNNSKNIILLTGGTMEERLEKINAIAKLLEYKEVNQGRICPLHPTIESYLTFRSIDGLIEINERDYGVKKKNNINVMFALGTTDGHIIISNKDGIVIDPYQNKESRKSFNEKKILFEKSGGSQAGGGGENIKSQILSLINIGYKKFNPKNSQPKEDNQFTVYSHMDGALKESSKQRENPMLNLQQDGNILSIKTREEEFTVDLYLAASLQYLFIKKYITGKFGEFTYPNLNNPNNCCIFDKENIATLVIYLNNLIGSVEPDFQVKHNAGLLLNVIEEIKPNRIIVGSRK